MLTPEQAQAVAAAWRPKFHDESNFDDSWQRYFRMNDAAEATLVSWLAKDLRKDAAQHVGHHEPPGPVDPFGRRLEYVHAELQVCPLCREHYEGAYLDHTGQQHKVHQEPDSAVNNLRFEHQARAQRYLEACAAAGLSESACR